MLAIPVIEISDGHATHLSGDGDGAERVDIGDPRDVARRWIGYGFQRLHIVDLDRAMGRPANDSAMRDLLWDGAVPVQAGGGVGTTATVNSLLEDGAEWVVVGSRAVEEPDWLSEIVDANAGAVIIALDVRHRRVIAQRRRGVAYELPRDVLDFIDDLARTNLLLGGLLITSAADHGHAPKVDYPLFEDIAQASSWPVLVAGVTTMGGLRTLEDRGIAGAILGMALYTGALDTRAVAEEFAGS